ncbi:heavy-metal-associated domain-containing protein [Limibacterium fermenti]|uniref:heavy-metal-associated domain-containing protein n=1 Tax=Limibacterium fermenti TaxID=3229863 RepID=UPI000E9785EC|nr:hypothetical protein [Porphyromonadaceae bacterium]
MSKENQQIFKFKTNIHCSGCVAKVTPFLDKTERVSHWDVDIVGSDKMLTVKSKGITEQEIMEIVEKAWFKIEPLKL